MYTTHDAKRDCAPHCHTGSERAHSGVDDGGLVGDRDRDRRRGRGHGRILAVDIRGRIGGVGLAVGAGDAEGLDERIEAASSLVVRISSLDEASRPALSQGADACGPGAMCWALMTW